MLSQPHDIPQVRGLLPGVVRWKVVREAKAETLQDRSYRALFAVPGVARILLSMQIARIGQAMMGVAIVLFVLGSYRSSTLAGLTTFFGLFPGLIASPIAGALLDRHGRTKLVVLDYLVALACLTAIGAIALVAQLPPWLMMIIVSVASLTAPLSSTGLRSLFPIIVPVHLWERVNAVDSIGWVLATILGPPIAATLVALWGGPITLIIIGLAFGAAAIVASGSPDPLTQTTKPGPLLAESWAGLGYVWRNPTLRGLGFSISIANLVGGTLNIVVPLFILQRLHMDTRTVGWVLAVQGVTGFISAIFFGRHDSRGRERMMLAIPMIGTALVVAILLVKVTLPLLILVMAMIGLLNGPLDVALFTLRQRRTDLAWTGRAFAISMSFNYLGIPIGSAMAGFVAARSIEAAVAIGVVASLIAGLLVVVVVPTDA